MYYIVQLRIKSPGGQSLIIAERIDADNFHERGGLVFFTCGPWWWKYNVALFKTGTIVSIQEESDAHKNALRRLQGTQTTQPSD